MLIIEPGLRTISHLCLSADGARVAAASDTLGYRLEVWAVPPGEGPEEVHTDPSDDAFELALDPVTGRPVYADPVEWVRSTAPDGWAFTGGFGGPLKSFALAPDGRFLVTGTEELDGPTPQTSEPAEVVGWSRRWDAVWAEAWRVRADAGAVASVVVFPDGQRVGVLAVTRQKRGFGRRTLPRAVVTVRDIATGRVEQQTEIKHPELAELTVAGPHLIGRAGRNLLVWDAADLARPAVEVRVGKREVAAVAGHPSGHWLATVSRDPAVTLWAAGTWRPVRQLAWDVGRLGAVAVSGNGLVAAAGGDGGTVVVWDVDG